MTTDHSENVSETVTLGNPNVVDSVNLYNILGEAANAPAYLVWSAGKTGSSLTKMPCDPDTGIIEKPNTAAARGILTLDQAVEKCAALNADHRFLTFGIGVYPPRSGLVFLDLDDCVTDTGIAPWATDLAGDAYTEYSPSGNGLRVILSEVDEFLTQRSNGAERGNVGVYGPNTNKFVTLTGNHAAGGFDLVPLSPESCCQIVARWTTATAKIRGEHTSELGKSLFGTGRSGMESALQAIREGTSLHPATFAYVSIAANSKGRTEIEEDLIVAYSESKAAGTDRWNDRFPRSIDDAMEWTAKRDGFRRMPEITTQERQAAQALIANFRGNVIPLDAEQGVLPVKVHISPDDQLDSIGAPPVSYDASMLTLEPEASIASIHDATVRWYLDFGFKITDPTIPAEALSGPFGSTYDPAVEAVLAGGAPSDAWVEDGSGAAVYLHADEFGEWCAMIEALREAELLFEPEDKDDLLNALVEARPKDTSLDTPLQKLPGMAHDVTCYAQDSAYRVLPYEVCALTALTAISGAIAHRAEFVCPEMGGTTPLNLDVVMQMPTGAGKENLRQVVMEVAESSSDTKVADAFASPQGAHRFFVEAGEQGFPSVLLAQDEFGKVLKASAAKVGGNESGVSSWLMQVLGRPYGVQRAGVRANDADTMPDIVAPYLVQFATTAEDLESALGSEDVLGGLMNRKLLGVLPYPPPLKPDNTRRATKMPDALTTMLKSDLYRLLRGTPVGKIPMSPEGRVQITADASGVAVLGAFAREADRKYTGSVGSAGLLWGRASAHSLKIAGILALCDYDALSGMAPQVREEHATAACAVVRRCFQRMTHVVVDNVHEGTKASMHITVITKALRKHGGWMAKKALSRGTRSLATMERDDALEALLDMGDIEQRSTFGDGTMGRPTTEYRLSPRRN